MLPARLDACYYCGCSSVRPDGQPPDPATETATASEEGEGEVASKKAVRKAAQDLAIIQAAMEEYGREGPRTLRDPGITYPEGEGPTVADLRRGSTSRGACRVCGAAVWRREREVERGMCLCHDHRNYHAKATKKVAA